jgi:hypothetical protein
MNHTEIDEHKLLSRLRSQSEYGPMQPRLYEIFEFNGHKLPDTSFEWMFYAGMGDIGFHAANDTDHSAAKSLLRKGDLVRTFEENIYGMKQIRRIEHFDDVKFGLDQDNEVIIFNFTPTTAMPDPVVRPDKTHRSAIARVKMMLESKTALVDQPLKLTQGDVIRPVIHNKGQMEIRTRQMDFKA